MNENHAKLCPSPEWAAWLQGEILPPLAAGVTLGDEMLEIGPGPGAATGWLRHKVKRLVALEADEQAASDLAAKHAGTNVEVRTGDATAMPFADGSFDSAGSFTMLHHIPTAALQDRLLSEVLRVLRPGGVLIGSDSLAGNDLHHFHADDTYNPVEPAAFLTRLQVIGFRKITISVDYVLTFTAHKPAAEEAEEAGAS
ncbi:MAG TPA: class I SAM-dependent methyltransferase [Streptosporangiaceae bacterium]